MSKKRKEPQPADSEAQAALLTEQVEQLLQTAREAKSTALQIAARIKELKALLEPSQEGLELERSNRE